ncbi:MAG: glycoside hydrolase family 32 protein [Verrucomicrobiota bacterium]
MRTACFLLILGLLALSDVRSGSGAGSADAITRAMASDAEAAPRAEADPSRPIYHFRPPANWMNDPNGPIYHKGYYHMFYQHNPYGDQWGNMHWGHARSRDLVRWEHLPIALWPSKEAGEEHVFSGCALINPQRQPMIFYTSIAQGKSASEYAEQWVATGDSSLIHWQKNPANPVLSEALHGSLKIYDWRDPFFFQHQENSYLVLGGHVNQGKDARGVVNLYQATNRELTQWKYVGVLFSHPDSQVKNIECPNFFKLGKRWVLVISPHGPVQYFVGDFDVATHQFKSVQRGTLDIGGNYYAPNCMLDPNGRRLMWGWINGFKGGNGWNGCLTMPRILTVGSDDQLRQEPAPELKKLRGKKSKSTEVAVGNSASFIETGKGDAMEILAEFEPADATAFGLKVRRSTDGQREIGVSYDGHQLEVAGAKAPFKLLPDEKTLKLHVFLDRSVMEVFVNNRACFTRVIYPGENDLGFGAFATGGKVRLRSLEAWPLRSIW